jgi:hypothetical protein
MPLDDEFSVPRRMSEREGLSEKVIFFPVSRFFTFVTCVQGVPSVQEGTSTQEITSIQGVTTSCWSCCSPVHSKGTVFSAFFSSWK